MANNTFFSSDFHYGHENISGPKQSKWKAGYRDFNSVKEMNDTIVDNINAMIGQDDVLYCLGDWSFGGIDNIWNFRKRVNCRNINHILGNHDSHIRNDRTLKNVYLTESGDSLIDGIPSPTKKWKPVFAQDLFLSVKDVDLIYIEKQPIFMSHYAHRIWEGSHKGYWHLYGHSHDSLEKTEYGKSMDVGLDAAYRILGSYRPFSFEEIKQILDKREIYYPDHHNSETNVK